MHKTTRSYRQWQEEKEDCEQCKEVWLDVMAALCKGWGRQNNSGPPKMSLPYSMNAECVTLDLKKTMDLADVIEQGSGERYQINTRTLGR